MKTLLKSLFFFCVVTCSSECLATTYTWNGATSVWNLNTNWLPSTGFPGSGDNVIIVTATAQPTLNATQSITDFTINSGTLNLNTFTLTITGVATYTAGIINNGTITSTGSATTFSGTVFGAVVNATSASIKLNGSTFNSITTITQNGGADVLSNGGNTFNAVTTITNNGGGFFALANNAPDIFATDVTFNNTGTDELYVAYNSTGNQFNGVTTFNNSASALIIYSNAGIGGTAAYNGNVVVNNASAVGGINFGIVGGTATLANTKTITVGGSGFTTGKLLLRDFTQTGTTAQTLTLTGTALIETGPAAIFNGNATITSPQVLLNGTRFNSAAAITKNGITQNNSNGGNVFVGAATISNTGAGVFLLGNAAIDTFNDLAIVNTGTSQIFLANNAIGHLFNGNITFQQTTGTGIFFGSGTGTSTLAATKTLSTVPGVTGGTLKLTRFTQTGATPQALTLSGGALLQMGPSVVFGGNVTFVSSQVLLNGCTFNGTAAITKNGAVDNVGVGGNIFNGVTTLTCSGGGNFEMGDTAPEVFNTDLTLNNTAQGRFQIGINSAGNLFNGTTTINHGGNTTGLNTVLSRSTTSTAVFNGNLILNCTNTVAASGIIIGNDGTVTINGNVTVSSTNGRGILFNSNGLGSVTLANGFTVTAGAFTTGTLSFNKFIQTGATPQNITLTGTADITFTGSSIFNAVSTFVAPQLFLNGGRFNNTVSLTKNGATANAGSGGNMFNGSTTITSSGAGVLRLANTTADDFNGDATFVSNGAGGLDPAYARATTFAGNVTVNSAATIVFGTNGGVPTFDGGTAQTINKTGAANPTFTRMAIAKTANDVTLNTEIFISTQLTFATRYIISSSSNPVTFLDNATVAGVANASFVSGPVRKTGNDGFIFPVGKNGFYRPIEMSAPASATDQFTGEYFLADPNPSFAVTSKDASINHLSRCEYWRLDRTIGSSNVSVTLSWNTTSCGVTNLSELLVAAWDGTTWKDQGNNTATTGNTTAGTVTSLAPVTIFGPFTLGSTTTNNPLPIELINFNAKLNGNSVDLSWSTLSEKNNDYFVVEKTIAGEKFEPVDTVKGAGNSTATLRYAAKDTHPITGDSYYRLKQVDFDGSHTYSKLVLVNFVKGENFSFTLYPNPSSQKTSLVLMDIPESTQEILVVVYAMNGNTLFSGVVKTGSVNGNTFVLDPVNKLSAGIYIVSVACGKSVYRQKLVIN